MILVNFILFILIAALGASMYYYYKEKKLLKEFVRHSRRHSHHQNIDEIIRQKANRYLSISRILFCVAVPLLIQNFVEGFIENNWKWLLPVVLLSILLWVYRSFGFARNSRVNKSLAISFDNTTNS